MKPIVFFKMGEWSASFRADNIQNRINNGLSLKRKNLNRDDLVFHKKILLKKNL